MNWVIGIGIDLVLVAIILLCVKIGSKNGFAKTFVSFFGFLAALVVAGVACAPVAGIIYDVVVKKPAQAAIESKINSKIGDLADATDSQISQSVNQAISEMPNFVKKTVKFENKGGSVSSVISQDSSITNVKELSEDLTERIIRPLAFPVIKIIVFAILFIILSIIFKIIAGALKIVNKIPLIGGVNVFLGGLIGALKGIIFVLLLHVMITFIVGDIGNIFGILTPETLGRSLIMNGLSSISPLGFIGAQLSIK